MILSKRPDIERFLGKPDPQIRAAVIYGRDMGVVHDRAGSWPSRSSRTSTTRSTWRWLTDGDMDADGGRLEGELAAQSLMGGRRLVRVRFATEKAGLDKQAPRR